jgi:hypothetical protein
MIKNIEKYNNNKNFINTEIILIVFSVLYIFLFLLTNKVGFLAYIWSDLLYDFVEYFYNLTSSFFVILLIICIFIYISYKVLKSTKNKFQKSSALILVFFSFLLTFQKGKDIDELKSIGYDVMIKIEEYYKQNDRLPSDLMELYPKNYSKDSLAYIIRNFFYLPYNSLSVRDYRLFIKSPIISPTTYLYSERKKKFVTFD